MASTNPAIGWHQVDRQSPSLEFYILASIRYKNFRKSRAIVQNRAIIVSGTQL
jgi:hypothetical protein